MTPLFKVLSGSRLYGTDLPTSDWDYKVVFLPTLADLISLRRVSNYSARPNGVGSNDTMPAGAEETEFLPLQVLLRDYYEGQAYALETVMFIHSGGGEELDAKSSIVKGILQELVEQFTNRSVSKMVGYAVSQANAYGVKTERYDSIRGACDVLEAWKTRLGESFGTTSLKDAPLLLERLMEFKFIMHTEMLNGSGGSEMTPAIKVTSKVFPLTSKLGQLLKSLKSIVDSYGDRVKSFSGTAQDWKALSHSIRICQQILQLNQTGKIDFPLHTADYLREVKQGIKTIDEVNWVLKSLLNIIDEVVANSVLPEKTVEMDVSFETWKEKALLRVYDLTF